MGTADRRRRWLIAGLTAYLVAAAVVLFAPVSYSEIVDLLGDAVHGVVGVTWFGNGWIEFTANIALFVPLGFLLTALLHHPWWGAVTAAALSVATELAQLALPARTASTRDILANALGAATGAALAWLFVRRRNRIGSPPSPPTGERPAR